jgi:uncharacterized membrane protein YtjA (UPF0391 family)
MSVWSLGIRNRIRKALAELAAWRINQIYLAHRSSGGIMLLRCALLFFVVALIASVFGFLGIAAVAVAIAKILFFVFLVGGAPRRPVASNGGAYRSV